MGHVTAMTQANTFSAAYTYCHYHQFSLTLTLQHARQHIRAKQGMLLVTMGISGSASSMPLIPTLTANYHGHRAPVGRLKLNGLE
ncbi:hypothetical protein GALMADRAFT_698029 [Galerina marginata CBS 339.88]|uniref:Uncharacterized protein n=1 Tax=Galerina marginata (strain CBS 339.88) TaxID=685588 RepID=A0A067TYI1_GALM3|nr:hypothetical protein GALMADRAFT_698029 [Galerina marginata CBS 339.88]